MTKETALRHIRNAWIAGLISAGATLLIVVAAASGSSAFSKLGFDWWNLSDVAVILGLCYGVYRKSRICTILLLTYYVGGRIYVWITMGNVQGMTLALVFGYFFVQGVRGTFAYHSLSDPPAVQGGSSKARKWLWVIGGAVTFTLIALIAGLVYIGSVGPSNEVVPGRQLRARFVSKVRSLGLLEEGEKIHLFYSDALVNVEDGFYLFTDRKVVVYKREYSEPAVIVPYAQIDDISLESSGSALTDSQITLKLTDRSYVLFPVTTTGGGDKKFYEALRETWNSHRPTGTK